MALTDAFEKLRDALVDLGTLETSTYRGNIKSVIENTNNDDFATLLDKARTSGELTLLLYTRLDGDGDSVHICANEEIDSSLIEAHKAAFDMGRQIRQGYIELFRDVAQSIIVKK